MTIDINDLINSIKESLSRIEYIDPDNMPDIPLYMDQVTHFMESLLGPTKRSKDDKILTKTMINNYTKNKLLPPPEKKKYSKDHLLTLIFIYYFKSVLSLEDIKQLLCRINDRYNQDSTPSLEEIFSTVFSMEEHQVEQIINSVTDSYDISRKVIGDLDHISQKEREFLEKYAFISLLNFDIFVKKLLIEKIIDSLPNA